MLGDRQVGFHAWFCHHNMASHLSDHIPSELFKCLNRLFAGNICQFCHFFYTETTIASCFE